MIQKVIMVGRVGRTPEVKMLNENQKVAKFTLATSETYKNKQGEKITHTEWHNIVVWRKLADVAEKFVTKGQLLYIEGKIRNKSWQDKDGTTRYSYEIEAESFQMLSSNRDNAQAPASNNDFVPDVPGVDTTTGEVYTPGSNVGQFDAIQPGQDPAGDLPF